MQQFAVNSSSMFESVRHYFNMIRITLAPTSSRKFDVLSNREITPALPAFMWFHVADKYFRAKETGEKFPGSSSVLVRIFSHTEMERAGTSPWHIHTRGMP